MDRTAIRTRLARAALATVLMAAAGSPALGDTGLAVRLSAGTAPGEVLFELVNEGERPVSVLRTGTALETELAADVFAVRPVTEGDGARPTYVGRLVKRLAPRVEDFVEIAPGGSRAALVDLERFYDVPLAGDYRVDYRGAILVATDAEEGPRVRRGATLVDAAPRTTGLELALAPSRFAFRARPPTFNGCEPVQRNALVEATGAAEGIAGEALSSLEGLPAAARPTAARYLHWFGAHDAARYRTVANGFRAILGALSGETLNYDCSCREEGVFAYVFPFQPYDVYICPTFFRANLLGTDSRAGTLVHELSHFEALVGTDDTAYGHSAAAALAENEPARAVDNADNYEYFAENTPALPMGDGGGSLVLPPDDTPTLPPGDTRFAPLPLDIPVRDTLEEGALALFVTDEADTVSLTSLDGDANLYVYSDPALGAESLVCDVRAPSRDTVLDVCELPRGTTHYVVVRGETDASFELVASVQSTPPPTVAPPRALATGSSDSGELDAEGLALYTATAPVRLELTSDGGDADLFVFADSSLAPDQLLCAADAVDLVDVCELAGEGTLYVVVYGFTAGAYRLDARAPSGSGPPGPLGGPANDGGVFGGGPAGDSSGGSGGVGWGWLLLGGAALGVRRARSAARRTTGGGDA